MNDKTAPISVTYRLAGALAAAAAVAPFLPGAWTDPNKYALISFIALAVFDILSFPGRRILLPVGAAALGAGLAALYLALTPQAPPAAPYWSVWMMSVGAYAAVIISRWVVKARTRAAEQQ